MKRSSWISLALALTAAFASTSALAHGHVGFGFYFGVPVFPPPYYYPPAPYYYPPYYPPAVVAAPAAPATYVERSTPEPAPQDNDWYYCPNSKTYYPYVKECAGPWQRVPARPPGS